MNVDRIDREAVARQHGSTLVAMLLIILFLAALAASATMMSSVGMRASNETDQAMRAFYLADSGAQVANSLLRTSGGTLEDTSFVESFSGGDAEIDVTSLGDGLFEVSSLGTFEDQSRTVVMHVQFASVFDLEGALQVDFGSGVEVEADQVESELNAATMISGLDHDENGDLLTDQDDAVYGLAMSPIPGDVDTDVYVDVSGGASLEGSPAETSNEVEGHADLFQDLVAHARDNADVLVSGSAVIDNDDDGVYGTEDAPKLVYVELGDEESFEMEQNVVGYGTLVIDAGKVTLDSVLKMRDSTEWRGLVVLHFRDEADVPGGSLVALQNYAKIIGGLVVNFRGDNVTFSGDGNLYEGGPGNASILYSSKLVKNAVGVPAVVDTSAEIVSYQAH